MKLFDALRKLTADSRYPGEIALLSALILVLPIMEAPKNLLWFFYIATWIVNRWRAGDFGGRWDGWDTLIVLWIASGFVVAAFAGLHHNEWSEPRDIVRYATLLWAIKRSRYGRAELRLILTVVPIACAIALAGGFWTLFISHSRKALQLNSVGHVNHSAIYVLVSYGAALALTLAFWRSLSIALRIVAVLLCCFLAAGIVISASRAAVGVMPVLMLLLAVVWLRRSRKPLLVMIALCAMLGAGMYFGQADVVQKQQQDMANDNVLSYRDQIWNQAIAAWRKYPVFGVGMGNFNQISTDKVKQWVEESGRSYEASRYMGTAHAHNLYLNTLAERGLVGFAAVASILLAWLYGLVRRLPSKEDNDVAWALWGGSFAAWLVTVVIGMVNTTLHHENGLLVAVLLGAWLAFTAARSSSAEPAQ